MREFTPPESLVRDGDESEYSRNFLNLSNNDTRLLLILFAENDYVLADDINEKISGFGNRNGSRTLSRLNKMGMTDTEAFPEFRKHPGLSPYGYKINKKGIDTVLEIRDFLKNIIDVIDKSCAGKVESHA